MQGHAESSYPFVTMQQKLSQAGNLIARLDWSRIDLLEKNIRSGLRLYLRILVRGQLGKRQQTHIRQQNQHARLTLVSCKGCGKHK
jgi:hypothetical protein